MSAFIIFLYVIIVFVILSIRTHDVQGLIFGLLQLRFSLVLSGYKNHRVSLFLVRGMCANILQTGPSTGCYYSFPVLVYLLSPAPR